MLFANSNKFFRWQRDLISEIVDGDSTYGIFEKSRRVGGTWAFAIGAVEFCLKTGLNCWFSSSDEKNAKEFIAYCQAYCNLYDAVLGTKWIDCERNATTEVITLPNGARINALSSNPKALRGKDGLVVLDEVALHSDGEELWRAAQPCVIQRGKLWLLSTHNGPSTTFFKLATEAAAGKPDWKHFRVTLVDAVEQGYALKFAKRRFKHLLADPEHPTAEEIARLNTEFIASIRRACTSEDAYGQEFLCKPLSLSALIGAAEYDALTFPDNPAFKVASDLDLTRRYRPLFVGIDIGRTTHLTAAWILEQYENPKATGRWDRFDYKTIAVKTMQNAAFPLQFEALRPIIGHPDVSQVAVDPGGVGRALCDAFVDLFPDRVVPVNFTNSLKGTMAERSKGHIQAKRVSLPDDAETRDDFLALHRTATKSGGLTYDGTTRGGGHCDRFWAFALALHAAEGDGGMGLELVDTDEKTEEQERAAA